MAESQSGRAPTNHFDPGRPDQELMELMLSATNDGVVDWDLVSGRAWYSLRWKMLLGYEDHELVDSPDLWKTLSHPADLPVVEELLRESIENTWPFAHRWRMRHRNEDWRWLLCRSVVTGDAQGRPVRMVSVFNDISDQVHAEERYRALADGIPDAILRIRRDGVVLDEKPAVVPIALVRPGRHAARNLAECAINRDWAQATLAAVSEVAKTGEAIAFEHGDGMGQPCVETRLVKSGDDEAVCIARDITARKQAERRLVESLDRLNKTQRQLMEASRLAGMAEVASSVLHNVGNVLNSVNVSATTATEILAASPLDGLGKAVRMLGEHRSNLDSFLSQDPKGKRLLPFLERLTEILLQERERVRLELESLQKNVDHIKMIVTTQQSNARSRALTERLAPTELVEDAIKLSGAWDGRDDVQLVRDYQVVPEADADRHKLLQIVINLLTNARHAVASVPNKRVVVRVASSANERFAIEVEDSGCGIPSENLRKIFNHGFTTRKDGHGFGLHGSALAAGEMGGTLTVTSAGLGQGARFALELPLSPVREGGPR